MDLKGKKTSEQTWQTEKGLVTTSMLLRFYINFHKRRPGYKKKMRFDYLTILTIFFQNILFPKEFFESQYPKADIQSCSIAFYQTFFNQLFYGTSLDDCLCIRQEL